MKLEKNIKEIAIPKGLIFTYAIIYFKQEVLFMEREDYIKQIKKELRKKK